MKFKRKQLQLELLLDVPCLVVQWLRWHKPLSRNIDSAREWMEESENEAFPAAVHVTSQSP